MRKKLLFGIIAVIALIAFAAAAIYTEPWNSNQRGGNHNLTEMGWISANTLNGTNIIGTFTGDVEGDMNWTFLKNYPVYCPGAGAITGLNDTVTCEDLWFNIAGNETITGDMNFSGGGIYNLSFIESADWTNITITESQVSDLQIYIVNATNLTIADKITFKLGEIIDNIVDGLI
ncbi:unnamed protein product, partial [marine sediment metagenome]